MDSAVRTGAGNASGTGGVWPKKPGSRKVAGDTPWVALMPLHPVPIRTMAANDSSQVGFKSKCITAS